ncbi:non-canonical purine NTP pyrophosphatase [Hoyosella rhizosphaerae]|uniref:dITP/XTP pyrophosphatase n=1 Tax=Hoyosella rhizosphaerae TaxID=1755582 RepID=A0A916UBK5_9ACTN|nr:non-canonical purine NTP pyrophosphatase [Hoyosella rhizosphaerae]MBN4925854.1 non-canonical purine NTP pyrophosphatase [Hoyosella rhizosphaerae]GGC67439.1 non-canonical purine NTP pyrophosphatase [Hoyosella rhizosphaerae]
MTSNAREHSRTLLVASRNAKKLSELQRMLDAAGIVGVTLVSLADVAEYPETPETGETFEQNALVKARDGVAATGYACVADDSGLEVAALHGMPGVLSARWSGTHGADDANTALVLAQLQDVPEGRREAAFVSACALVLPDGSEHVVRGTWRGALARSARGSGGFGYDPIFIPVIGDNSPYGELAPYTAAEMSPEEKDAVSHRGRALRQLLPIIAQWVGQEWVEQDN